MNIVKEGEFIVVTETIEQVNTQKYKKEDVEEIISKLQKQLEMYEKILTEFK